MWRYNKTTYRNIIDNGFTVKYLTKVKCEIKFAANTRSVFHIAQQYFTFRRNISLAVGEFHCGAS